MTKQLSNLMKVDQYFLACAGILSTALETRTRLGKLPNITLEKELQTYRDNACKFLNSVTSPDSELYFEKLENTYHQLKSDRDVLKEHMLTTGTKGLISLDQMINAIDFITEIKQLNEHWYKAIKILAHLENETRKDVSDVEELSD